MLHVSFLILIYEIIQLEISFDGEHFGSAGSSKYSHRLVYGMANYQGKALTTGCNDPPDPCMDKTELMNMNTLEWADGPNYPYNPA